MLPYYSASAGYVKTFGFNNGNGVSSVYEYEQPGSTNTVAWGFTSRELTDQLAQIVEIDTVMVTNSGVSTGAFTVSVKRIFNGITGSPVTSTLSFTGGTPQTLTDAPIGGEGLRAQLKLTSTMPGGTSILSINAFIKRTGSTGYTRT
jgi:hypothetical protein